MALVVKDRVKEITTTTGTSDLTLGGAVFGFQTFAIIGNGNTTYYGIYDSATGDWEVGVGTYSSTGPTLTRDTVFESSNAGSKVSFGAGSKEVFCTYPAERSVYLDAAGSAVTVLDIGTLGTGTANITSANITAGTVSTTPTSSNDLANKAYVDSIAAQGITYHQPVKYEVPNTTGNLTATYNNGTGGVGATLTNNGTKAAFAPDGPTAQVGDRILVYNQTNAYENGVYEVTTVGTPDPGGTNWVLTRAADADSYGLKDPNALGQGDAFYVTSGNTGAGETYVCNTAGTITFGTTAITFAQISSAQIYSAGAGLTLSNLQFSLTPVGSANTYGSASSVPVFTTNAYGQVTSVTNTGIAITASAVSGLAASATTDTTNAANITSGTLNSARLSGSYTNITGVGTLTAGTWNANTIGAAYGGTGLTSYTVGDLLYADTTTSLAKLADVATGNALISGGVGTAPAWGKIGLATHVSGTLTVGNGGTGATTLTGYVKGNGTSAFTASATIPNGDTTATSANTVNAIVARDGSGNFSAGTITASLNGNASTASSATSAGTATNLAGGVAGAVPYQSASGTTAFSAAGSAGQYLQSNGTSAPSWITPPTIGNGTLTLNVSGTGLSGSQTFTANQSGNATFTVTSNATSANTASTIVARDASNNFSAGTITATLNGNASTATSATSATNASNLTGGNISGTMTGTLAAGLDTFELANNNNYASFRVIRNNAGTSNRDGMYIGYANANSGRTRIYSDGSTSGHVYADASGNLYRSDAVQYVLNTGTWSINISGNAANVTGTVAVANGGTGNTSLTAGRVLIGNGTSAVISDIAPWAFDRSVLFTGSTSYTTPYTGLYKIWVVGGGGSGGAASANASPNSALATGGGAGGLAVKVLRLTAGTVLTITVGTGGTGVTAGLNASTNGNGGGASSVSGSGFTTITANGGGGGIGGYNVASAAAASGGTASGGDGNYTGGGSGSISLSAAGFRGMATGGGAVSWLGTAYSSGGITYTGSSTVRMATGGAGIGGASGSITSSGGLSTATGGGGSGGASAAITTTGTTTGGATTIVNILPFAANSAGSDGVTTSPSAAVTSFGGGSGAVASSTATVSGTTAGLAGTGGVAGGAAGTVSGAAAYGGGSGGASQLNTSASATSGKGGDGFVLIQYALIT